MIADVHGYEPSTYGEGFADVYDEWYARTHDLDACVDRIAQLASAAAGAERTAPRVLELGIGTGRVTLPLAARGIDARGIDSSPSMVDRMRSKPGGADVPVTIGELGGAQVAAPTRADEPAAPEFHVVFIAYNTFFNLHDEASQRRGMDQARSWLTPEGRFVVEAFVPEMDPGAPPVTIRTMAVDRLVLSASIVDEQEQTIEGQYVDITQGGIRLRPWRIRYLTPTQLDRLAEGAGLVLEARWSSWAADAFDEASGTHVSVYRPSHPSR
jgi:SAM-dependent methyltransferase